MIYETGLMNLQRAQLFDIWFSKNIGAELEINTINDDVNQIYFICSDLEQKDVHLLKDWENKKEV
jgi:hypothetical protein